MLIRLSDSVIVAASEVAEINIDDRGYGLTVMMRGGRAHHVSADYGKSVYDTARRLMQEVNQGLAAMAGAGEEA